MLGITDFDTAEEGLMRVDLYQDIDGEYFPILRDPDRYYTKRPDSKVEEVKISEYSCSGRVVENHRGRITKQ